MITYVPNLVKECELYSKWGAETKVGSLSRQSKREEDWQFCKPFPCQ